MKTTGSMVELAQRLVACEDWRWMTGMVTLDGSIVWAEGDNPFLNWIIISKGHVTALRDSRELLPDLTQPSTLGCLLQLVREAWQGRYVVCGENQLKPEVLVEALELAREAFVE